MFRRKFLMAAIVAAIAVISAPAKSQAGFVITVSDGTNPDLTFVSGTNLIFGSDTLGDYTITVSGFANSPGGLVSLLSNTTIGVVTTGPAAAVTLTITAVVDGFTNIPAATGVHVFTSLSASILEGSATGHTELNGAPVVGSAVAIPGPGQDDANSIGTIPSNPYDLGNVMVLSLDAYTGTTLSQRATVGLDSNLTAVPAPAGLILAATALPFVGLLRRRLRKPEATIAA
jgi:hypothetical protein